MRISSLAYSVLPSILLNAAAVAAVPSGDYCAPAEKFYSRNGWNAAKVEVCLSFYDGVQLAIYTSESQFQSGLIWYPTSSQYPARWEASGTIDGSEAYFSDFQTQTSEKGGASVDLESKSCGSHTVTLEFSQEGPYWGGEVNEIKSGLRTYTINVPC